METINELCVRSKQSYRARQHVNLHIDYSELSQRVLNAIEVSSYIRPHRHALDPKTESLFALRGTFALIVFNELGVVQQVIGFGTEHYLGDGVGNLGVEVAPGTWHTVLALVPDSVLLEVKAGPFDPSAAKEYPLWAPEEGTAESVDYLSELHALAKRTCAP